MSDFVVGALCTLTVTGETLVLKKNFPSIRKGFSWHYLCWEKGFVPLKSKDFSSIKAGKTF